MKTMNENRKAAIADIVFRTCLGIKPDEKVLILCDEIRMDLASIFVKAAKTFSKNVNLY